MKRSRTPWMTGLAVVAGLCGAAVACECPPQGSGAVGVAAWKSLYCPTGTPNCTGTPVTCNVNFTMNLVQTSWFGPYVTFEWEICQIGGAEPLSHWVFDTTGLTCIAEGYTLSDLIVGASFNGIDLDPSFYQIGLDPTTQIDGFTFNVPGTLGACDRWTVTFNTGVLADGYTLGEGCVTAATQAGNEDIRDVASPSPGYQCMAGPVCVVDPSCWQGETAWSAGPRYVSRGNWATYTPYVPHSTVTIYAGQFYEAGTASFSEESAGFVTITIDLNDGFRYAGVEENIKVQDYASRPTRTPRPGQFAYTFTACSDHVQISVPVNAYYGLHLDLERAFPCE